MSASISNHKLPSAIELKLRSVRLRHAALVLTHAVAVGVSVLIGLMILSMAIDWAMPFMDVAVRVLLTLGTLTAAIFALAVTGIRPVSNALGWNRAAGAVDDEIPQLEERWSTVASLTARDQSRETPMARAMAEQVTSEAVALEKIVQPKRVAPPVSLRPTLLTAAASGLILALLMAAMPQQMSILWKRFWSPTSNITATQLSSLTGDQLVPRGDQIELVTQLAGLPRSTAILTMKEEDGIQRQIQLRSDEQAPDEFRYHMRVNESLSYRVESGDGRTEWHQLQVIDFPEIADVQFSIEFPKYTRRESVQRDRIPRRIKVIQGSHLELAIKPREPLQRLSLSLAQSDSLAGIDQDAGSDSNALRQDLNADQDGWYRFRMQLLEDVMLQPTLWSPHGLKNQRRLFSRIEVIADKAPVARVVSPTDEMAVAMDERIEIEFEAHDDHGIATAELVVYDEARKDAEGNPTVVAVKDIPLGDQTMQKHIMGKTHLDLKELQIPEGSEISYAIRVTDNRETPLDDSPVRSAIAQPEDTNRSAEPNHEMASDANASSQDPESEPDGQKTQSEEDSALAQRNPGDRPPATESETSASAHADSDANKDLASEMIKLAAEPSETASDSKSPSHQSPSSDAESQRPPSATEATSDATKVAARESTENPDTSDVNRDATPPNAKTTSKSERVAKADDQQEGKSDRDAKSDADHIAATQRQETSPSKSKASESAGRQGTPPDQDRPDDESFAETPDRKATSPDDSVDPYEVQPREEARRIADASGTKMPPNPNSSDSPPDSRKQNENDNQRERDPSLQGRPPSASNANPLASNPRNSQNQTTQPANKFSLKRQQNRAGQNTLTNRRRLKITEKLAAIAKAEQRPGEDRQIRESVVEIDNMLAEIEAGLKQLVDHVIADADRAEQFRRLDKGLGNVEAYVADLREETKENQFAFVGLQMVDISRTHVTPARDRVFAAIQRPNASDADATASLQHTVRARELLGALLKRYDRVVQENKLQKAIDETVTMYEVYVQKRRLLMREARQNLNPLQRKMAIIEVDQEYLDRYAEVLKLRREMMEEFAQMLGDDPRLLSRYMELIKRRRKSLRDQLTELSQRQYEATEEMLGWLQIDETQKQDLWTIIAELRLHSVTDLAKDAAELSERIDKQMPLAVDATSGTPAEVIRQARHIASLARTISFDTDELIAAAGKVTDPRKLRANAQSLVIQFDRLSARLDRMQFEHDGVEAVTDFLEPRMLEARTVADQASAWLILSENLAENTYAGLVKTEQHQMAIATQLLRVEMLEMETDLDGQFQQVAETSLPPEIAAMIRQLHRLMESITFNQVAASFRAGVDRLDSAAAQQQLATDRFAEAEKLFDRIRREVVKALDEYDVRDPNIADLRDPTLDEFLARLEREPNIAAQLGIPNRSRNLRVLADSMLWQQNGGGGLGSSGAAAAARAKSAMKMKRQGKKKQEKPEGELTKEERKQRAEAKKAQQMLEKSLAKIEQQRDDPQTTQQQRQRLDQLAKQVKKMMQQNEGESSDSETWQRIAQSDQAKALIEAIARGEAVPDEQWNTLMSKLDDGLWQVRGKQPPEAYRKAIEQYQDQIRELMQTIE